MVRLIHGCLRQMAASLGPSRQVLLPTTFKCEDLMIEQCKNLKPKPDPDNLIFGKHFSDHMFEVEWNKGDGWTQPRICPLHDIKLHPGAKVLHYATELFEGLKAYRGVDSKIRLFRPMENMKRMNRGAVRCSLPEFDGRELLKCIKKHIIVDKEWVPYSTSNSLYIRPTYIGTEPSLGVAVSSTALLYIVLCPVGPYFPTGMKPVSLLADQHHVRAWHGGCGSYKMGSNYAPTIAVQQEAMEKYNTQQILWLHGDNHEVTEVGTMNFFMYWINEQGEEELVTAPLSGVILPGVTRMSLIELAEKWGDFKVSIRNFTMAEVIKGLKENRVKELFGAGTACVVCPVERIFYMDRTLEIPTMKDGAPLAMRFYKELTDIQYGRVTPHEWAEEID